MVALLQRDYSILITIAVFFKIFFWLKDPSPLNGKNPLSDTKISLPWPLTLNYQNSQILRPSLSHYRQVKHIICKSQPIVKRDLPKGSKKS